MNQLETYALEKEEEAKLVMKVIMNEFRYRNIDPKYLQRALMKIYQLGHNAGHCRGEDYLNKRVEGCV